MPQRIIIHRPGGYERIELEPFECPQPEESQILIECRGCGVNFADCCVRMGVYASAQKYVGWPITPGFEVSGVVKQIGPGVSRFQTGDRVIALTRFNGYTSHLLVDEAYVFPLPENLSFAQGAGLPAIFLTAWYGLCELAHPRPQSKILVHSAAGGVGSALVELGKLHQCMVVGVVGAPHKAQAVIDLGADFVIDKSSEHLWNRAEAIAPEGFDLIFDANGPETLRQSYRHLDSGGKLVVYGFHTMLSKGRGRPDWLKISWEWFKSPRFDPLQMTTDNRSVLAFNLSYLFDRKAIFKEAMNAILHWAAKGNITVPQVTSYPLSKAAAAQRDLESGATIGKLILIPD